MTELHEQAHGPVAEERAHRLSMQCWRAVTRAQTADDWRRAVELGRGATGGMPEAPEPHFNLAVALAGLAVATDDTAAREEAARLFDAGRALVPPEAIVRYAAEAASLLEARVPRLLAEPAVQYGLGQALAVLGRTVRARRALTAARADPTIGSLAAAALVDVPEPEPVRAAPVGRNDPCPCGSGKKYKRCHGTG